MGIQTTEGSIKVDADDPQFTYRGITLAIKVRVMMWPVVLGVVRQADGSWEVREDLTGDLFSSDPPGGGDVVGGWVKQRGGNVQFIREVILPRLNAWLAKLFPPAPIPVIPPVSVPPDSALTALHTAIKGIYFEVQPDNTVVARV